MYFMRNETLLPVSPSSMGWEFFIQKPDQFPGHFLTPIEIEALLGTSDRKFSIPAHLFQNPQFPEIQKQLKKNAVRLTLLIPLQNVTLYQNELRGLLEDGWSIRLTTDTAITELPEAVGRLIEVAPRHVTIMVIANVRMSACDILKTIDTSYWNRVVFNFTERIPNSGQDFHMSRSRSIVEVERLQRIFTEAGIRNIIISNFQSPKEPARHSFGTQDNPLLVNNNVKQSPMSSLPEFLWQLIACPAQILLEIFITLLNILRQPLNKSSYAPLRTMPLLLFNKTIGALYWGLYALSTRLHGGLRKLRVQAYWKMHRISSILYWYGYHAASVFKGLLKILVGFAHAYCIHIYWALRRILGKIAIIRIRIYWTLRRILNQIPILCIHIYWTIRRILNQIPILGIRIYWTIRRILNQIPILGIHIYWTIRRILNQIPILFIHIYWTIRRILNQIPILGIRIYWALRRIGGQTARYYTIAYWSLHRTATSIFVRPYWHMYYFATQMYGGLRAWVVVSYWKMYSKRPSLFSFLSLRWTLRGLFQRITGQLHAFFVRLYWVCHILFWRILLWPFRKIYWFSEYQINKRILRRDYGN